MYVLCTIPFLNELDVELIKDEVHSVLTHLPSGTSPRLDTSPNKCSLQIGCRSYSQMSQQQQKFTKVFEEVNTLKGPSCIGVKCSQKWIKGDRMGIHNAKLNPVDHPCFFSSILISTLLKRMPSKLPSICQLRTWSLFTLHKFIEKDFIILYTKHMQQTKECFKPKHDHHSVGE
mgnify:FL=1